MNDCSLSNIAAEYGSPSFVFDADELTYRVNLIRELLTAAASTSAGQIGLCYSIKANPFLIPVIDELVDKFEVCSPGELEIVKHYNIAPDKIIYSGVNKDYKDIREAIIYGADIITAESIRHFEIIREIADSINKKVNVILRLTSGNQFGMSIDDIRSILSRLPYQNINIDGIHYFAGTQRNNPKPQEKELNKLKAIIAEIRKDYGISMKKLEYGPGLPYPYFMNEDSTDTLAPLKRVLPLLSDISEDCELTIEMGRFIASSCGYYLTSICDIKESEGQKWCILDGGLNHVNYYGQMMGMKKPIIRHLSRELLDENSQIDAEDLRLITVESGLVSDSARTVEGDCGLCGGASDSNSDASGDCYSYALCGSLCTSNDILVREYELHEPKVGDMLVFENLGAYSITEGINLFLSRDMARVIIYSKGVCSLLRDTVSSWKINCSN